jgi:hypothetical protein
MSVCLSICFGLSLNGSFLYREHCIWNIFFIIYYSRSNITPHPHTLSLILILSLLSVLFLLVFPPFYYSARLCFFTVATSCTSRVISVQQPHIGLSCNDGSYRDNLCLFTLFTRYWYFWHSKSSLLNCGNIHVFPCHHTWRFASDDDKNNWSVPTAW